jgi:hypothetical protein
MKRYIVLTPPFLYHEIIVDGMGPYYEERDFIEIEAENKRDAVALGVKYMLTHRYPDGHRYQYVHDQRSDRLSPYTGVRATETGDNSNGQQ